MFNSLFSILICILWTTQVLAIPSDDSCLSISSNILSVDSNKILDVSYSKPSGYFQMASPGEEQGILKKFKEQKESGTFSEKLNKNRVKRVGSKDLVADFSKMSADEIAAISRQGVESFDELGYVTSGAGLWSRGGGAVKALVPYNVREVLGKEFPKLKIAGDIFAAKTNSDIIKVAGKTSVSVSESS